MIPTQRLVLLLLLTLILGCATTSPDEPYDVAALSPVDSEESALDARMRSAPLPFQGFAPDAAGESWRIGDELLYGVEYQDPGERISWTLGIRVESRVFKDAEMWMVTPSGRTLSFEEWQAETREQSRSGEKIEEDGDREFYFPASFDFRWTTKDGREWEYDSQSILVSVRVYDSKGDEVDRQFSVVPATYLEWGFSEACSLAIQNAKSGVALDLASLPDERVLEEARPYVGAIASVIGVFQVLRGNRLLEPILWKVVQKPSILSVVRNLGVDVSIQPDFERAEVEPRVFPGTPTGETVYRFPIQFVVNDSVALRSTLSVAAPDPPLLASGGLVAVDGVHPREPDRRISIRLLASKRGEPDPLDSAD